MRQRDQDRQCGKSVTILPSANTRETGVVDHSGQYGRPVFEGVSDGYCRGFFKTPEAADAHGNPRK